MPKLYASGVVQLFDPHPALRKGEAVSNQIKSHEGWRALDELGERIEPPLPRYRVNKLDDRTRADRRWVLDGIVFVLRTGCR